MRSCSIFQVSARAPNEIDARKTNFAELRVGDNELSERTKVLDSLFRVRLELTRADGDLDVGRVGARLGMTENQYRKWSMQAKRAYSIDLTSSKEEFLGNLIVILLENHPLKRANDILFSLRISVSLGIVFRVVKHSPLSLARAYDPPC